MLDNRDRPGRQSDALRTQSSLALMTIATGSERCSRCTRRSRHDNERDSARMSYTVPAAHVLPAPESGAYLPEAHAMPPPGFDTSRQASYTVRRSSLPTSPLAEPQPPIPMNTDKQTRVVPSLALRRGSASASALLAQAAPTDLRCDALQSARRASASAILAQAAPTDLRRGSLQTGQDYRRGSLQAGRRRRSRVDI